MKKSKLTLLATLLLSSTLMFSSCIGSFKLSNNLLNWNKSVSGKFVNELLFIVISPAYAVTMTADLLILNSIEFWTGKSALANETKTVKGENGDYLVERHNTGYVITNIESNEIFELKFNEETQTWSAASNGQEVDIFTFIDENNVTMHMPDGTSVNVELSEAGVIAFQEYVNASAPMFAAR